MKRGRVRLWLILSVASASGARAGPSYQVPVGPRALAMGSAHSAIADDATAIYWNPAGLSILNAQEILWTHANLYDTGLKDDYVVFASPLFRRLTLATDWYHSGFDDGELGFDENRIDLAGGFALHPKLSLGLGIKYLSRSTKLDQTQVREGSGFGTDFGVLAWPLPKLRVGVVVQDAFNTDVEYSNKVQAETYPRNTRFAMAYDVHSTATLALDIDDRVHTGGEYRPLRALAVRAGVEVDRDGDEDPTYSFGSGFRVGPFRIDYAYVVPPTLDATTHIGVAAVFFPASRVRIEAFETEEIFSSLARSYEREPIALARLRNLHDRPVTATLSLDAPEIMDAPTEREVVLRPKAVQEVELSALLSASVLEQTGDRAVPMKLSVRYSAGARQRTESKTVPSTVYGPGAIDWNRGVAQAAALVTALDPPVELVARAAAREAASVDEARFATRNLQQAAAIFETLSLLGVSYVADPFNPYSTISETPRAVDSVHYPRHTLASRTGDCDDTCVLLAALLANVGIRSQFVDVPGHLFLLVDSGLHARQRLAMPLDPMLLVSVDDALWVPIETTALAKGFAAAWATGAEEFSNWTSRGQVDLVDVAQAQSRFAPLELPGEGPNVREFDPNDLRNRLVALSGTLGTWREEYLASRFGDISDSRAALPDALNRLARVHFLAGRFEESRTQLERVLESHPRSALAHNNLAATYASQGMLDEALDHLKQALEAEETDGGIWLNLGLIRYVAGEEAGAREAIRRGIEHSGGLASAHELLGLEPADGFRAGQDQLTKDEVLALLQAALESVPAAAPPDSAETDAPAERPTPEATAKLRTAGPRAGQSFALFERLYWKE